MIKKKKRRKHYITGRHLSPKCVKPIDYRSGWEKTVCLYLDSCADVTAYEYECVAIPYTSNVRTGKVRLYFPDFLIQYANGVKKLVEVKRQDKLTDPTVVKKTAAGRKWATDRGMSYELWTNKLIEKLRLLNEQS